MYGILISRCSNVWYITMDDTAVDALNHDIELR